MTNHSLLSSEQALDDYFSSLLEESDDLEDRQALEESARLKVVSEPDPQAQPVEEKSYLKRPTEEIEVPNLEDVERLLEQLETSNPVAELDLEDTMVQNTADIAQPKSFDEIEEIQEWNIVEPKVEVDVQPEAEIEVADSLSAPSHEYESVSPEIEPEIAASTSLGDNEESDTDSQADIELETQAGDGELGTWKSTERNLDFQVLYFDVNSVTFAVPLDELGGIHKIAELNHLIGRPDWYLGLQTSRQSQLDVVDTAKWVMPEKLSNDEHKEKYQYIVMLGESAWGLASTKLMGTESLEPGMIRWRKTAGKRPWLAGMVKEKMCALIHVEALTAMLNAGLDVKALDN